ncbi:MAG: hypothetical protein N2486_01600 [Caloramator sp.]|nr:hypothetical protein [Caloramator sp.]
MKKSTKLILSISLILIFATSIFFVSKKLSTKSQQSTSKYMIAMAKKSKIQNVEMINLQKLETKK